jgi:hormone-sensitive lipase
LAPEFKFPVQLEECFYVYKWLVTTTKLGMRPSKIILVGDSAGGNLVASVTTRALMEGLRVPDGLLLYYPALDMCNTCFPSRLLFKNDPLVPLNVMKVCRQSYFPPAPLGEDETEYWNRLSKDMLISPMHVPDSLLSQFPPVYICAGMVLTVIILTIVGEFDPLLDECIIFAQRLKAFDKLCKLYIYEGLPHGFLSVSNKTVPEGNVAIRDGATIFQDLVKDRGNKTVKAEDRK